MKGRNNRRRREAIAITSALLLAFTLFIQLSSAQARVRVSRPNPEDRIVGGEEAPVNRYPSIALLSDKYGNFVCGGSLILPNVVLSAAHCTPYVEIAQLGVYNRILASYTSKQVETFSIVKKEIHPRYNKADNDYDFVLLKLSGSSRVATPVTINDDNEIPAAGSAVTAIGWGATSQGGSTSYILREVTMNDVSNDECAFAYGPIISHNMLCATAPGKVNNTTK